MEIYLVGGAVRDKQLGLPVNERDWVVVGATAQDMLARGYRQVGKDFPVFLHPETGEEYALARTERKTGPGYTGFECHAGADVSLEDDLRRRDLTINAMAEDRQGNLIDPYGGQEDLQQGLLRHVSPAFREDPVRILRTARFAARFGRYGFHVAHSTNRLMRTMVESGEVEHLVPERIWAELAKALASDAPQRFLTVLRGCGALAIVFPELDAQFNDDDSPHGEQPPPPLVRRLSEGAARSSDPLVRFGLLLWSLQPVKIDEFCSRLKAPREYCQLARQAAEWKEALGGRDATALVSAMQACNAFRQRERWERLLEVQRLAGVFDEAGITRLDHALNAAAEVTAADFSGRNLQGPAIGEAIFRERVRRVDVLVNATGDSGG